MPMDLRLRHGVRVASWLDLFVPHVAVDCVIFGFHDAELKLLLLKWKNADVWALPGGPVGRRESLDDAAHRVLRDRTGLRRVHLRQFHAFGGLARREADGRRLFTANGVEAPRHLWLFHRIVSVGYYALVDFRTARPTSDFLADACAWWPIDTRPSLGFDHDEIVARALDALRASLDVPGTGANLLPERFTMPELQRLHEAIQGRTLDRRNFQKRMLERGDIVRLDERRTGGAHRAPHLYRFVQPAGPTGRRGRPGRER
jgi:ADP-ribose pyrophosphatase YjhB (NUDIX family)